MMKRVMFVLCFVVLLALVSSASFSDKSTVTRVNYQVPPSFQTYYSGEGRLNTYWPILGDREQCEAREDVLLQVAPGGCQPAVVRSDLLAEQNVPVFCQIDALSINPLIEISELKNIRFRGTYPASVIGAGFHPARAAIRTRDKLLGDPLINNIGYVVLVLKKQEREQLLPEFVNVTLAAQIEYDAMNAFGVGEAEFILEAVNDQEWEVQKARQSFWRGRYFIRLERADANTAVVSLYYGDQKISTTGVTKGKPSNVIYMPGYYCRAGVQIEYTGLATSHKKARIEIGSGNSIDSIEVSEGSRFLNGKCSVTHIESSGIPDSGNVTISCSGGERFTLVLQPRLDQLLSVLKDSSGNPVGVVEQGEYLTAPLSEGIYGVKKNPGSDSRLYFKKRAGDSWSLATSGKNAAERLRYSMIRESLYLYPVLTAAQQSAFASKTLVSDQVITTPAGAEDAFRAAVGASERVAGEYPVERPKEHASATPFGQQALEEAVRLAQTPGILKQQTLARLLETLISTYPTAADQYVGVLRDLYSRESGLAGISINVDNSYKTVQLVSISTPSDSSSAVLSFSGTPQHFQVALEDSLNMTGLGVSGTLTNVRVEEITSEDEVRLRYYCGGGRSGVGTIRSDTVTLRFGQSAVETCPNSRIRLERVNLKEAARVRLVPWVKGTKSETNLTVMVGIEKRAIVLSPNKTQDRIDTLNASIKKWESISNNLGDVVSGLKAACFATAATLTVKNFISGVDGGALARQQTMQGEYGWSARCKQAIDRGEIVRSDGSRASVSYRTLTECYNGEKSFIESDVTKRKEVITSTNDVLERIERQHPSSTPKDSLVSGYSVDTLEAQNSLLRELKQRYPSEKFIQDLNYSTRDKPSAYTYADLREWYADKQLRDKGIVNADDAREQLEQRIELNRKTLFDLDTSAGKGGLEKYAVVAQTDVRDIEARFLRIAQPTSVSGVTIGETALSSTSLVPEQQYTHAVLVKGKVPAASGPAEEGMYLVVGTKPYNTLYPGKVYAYSTDSEGKVVLKEPPARVAQNPANFYGDNKIKDIRDVGGDLAKNTILTSERGVRYFETGPDKGLPAIVPFDVVNGWYVRVKSNLKIGNELAAYDASGLPRSWWICNVGGNGAIETSDECQQVISGVNSGVSILGLDESQSRRLIEQSRRAILDAAAQKGNKVIRINGQDMYQGPPATQFDNVECQDFMSADDCKLLFNVCDPVICPATRCDFGGKYPVADVIQTGIVGSTLLCLPNYREGVYVPVCLSGIHAGIESYVSILKNHRDCLAESLANGRMVGICDQLYSIYACEFFWRQVAPVANVLLPKLVEFAYGKGQGARGGGEYLTVMGAWQNTQNSIKYFTQTYAVNSLKAFQARSLEDVGSQFCKGFVSAKSPASVKSLLEPDSPPQFYAYFDTTRFSDVTVPATAHYKAFYHIFAGKDAGVYYSVYLKNPPESSYYYNAPYITIATGFIARGQYASETKDFTAPEGYKELCVRVNNQEECGFKQVSTDFAVNYLKDQYVAGELKNTDITSERECISGSPRLGSLLTPNIQAGGEETGLPQIYERGVVRICATRNPGATTEPGRYVEVGHCSDRNIKCWLDKQSVDNAITDANIGVKNETLSQLEAQQRARLAAAGAILSDTEAVDSLRNFSQQVQQFLTESASADVSVVSAKGTVLLGSIDTRFGPNMEKLVLNHHKAEALLLLARIRGAIAEAYLRTTPRASVSVSGPASVPPPPPSTSAVYSVHDPSVADPGYQTVYFRFDTDFWQWSFDRSNWTSVEVETIDGHDPFYKALALMLQLRGRDLSSGISILESNGARVAAPSSGTTPSPTPIPPSTTTTPSTTATAVSTPTKYLLGLANYEGANDYFAFRWNEGAARVEVKMRLGKAGLFGGTIGESLDWLDYEDSSILLTGDYVYDFTRDDVLAVLDTRTWDDAIFAMTKAALRTDVDAAIYFPKDDSNGLFDTSEQLRRRETIYQNIRARLGLVTPPSSTASTPATPTRITLNYTLSLSNRFTLNDVSGDAHFITYNYTVLPLYLFNNELWLYENGLDVKLAHAINGTNGLVLYPTYPSSIGTYASDGVLALDLAEISSLKARGDTGTFPTNH